MLPSGHGTDDEYAPGMLELLPCEAWQVMHARLLHEAFPVVALRPQPALVWRNVKMSSPLSQRLSSGAGVPGPGLGRVPRRTAR
jgi:hypothetical protein